jgi:hypothetical protein
MKRGIVAGAIAGLAGGISGVLFAAIGSQLGIFGTPPNITPMEFTIYWLIISTIFGAIFGMIYAKVYDLIPGKSILKGLIAGLALWLIKDIATGVYLGVERAPVSVIAIIWVGFFIWVVYGLVIGVLYKK